MTATGPADTIKEQLCFPAAAPTDIRILILGSFPGKRSLEKRQYYAHPRNVFWRIMGEVFDFDYEIDYRKRIAMVNGYGVGIWDVLQSCQRYGSLDSKIETATIVTNDFTGFFDCHPQLRLLVFNGSRAEAEFRKRIVPTLGDIRKHLDMIRMPSTSPAMATMNYQEKYKAWRNIKAYL